jgi:hypothetical protein
LGFSSGGTERDWEQTAQGGSGGWIRHLALGTALEQPVPRNTSEDEDGGGDGDGGVPSQAVAGWPLGMAAAIGFGLVCRSETTAGGETGGMWKETGGGGWGRVGRRTGLDGTDFAINTCSDGLMPTRNEKWHYYQILDFKIRD